MLSRRWLVNGLLLVVIAVLAVIGYRLDRPPEPQPQAAHEVVDIAAIEHIEMRTADGLLAFQKQQTGWVLLDPLHWPADRASVERLFRVVDTGATRPLQGADVDPAKLGLDDPAAQLQLGDTAIRFGIVNNIGERRYTLIDTALYLLPDVYLPLIRQGISGFIDRRLLPPAFELAALNLPEFELHRDTDGAWRAAGREQIGVAALARLVDDWQRLEATRIGAYHDPRAPRDRIVAELHGGERIELLLLATEPEILIANPALGLQYHFRGELYDRLFTLLADENSA